MKFIFPAGMKLGLGGFTVVGRDRAAFTQQYGGQKLELTNA